MIALMTFGCMAPTPDDDVPGSPGTATASTESSALLSPYGLDIRRILVPDDEQRIEAALRRVPLRPVLPEEDHARWRRNGLRLYSCDVVEATALVEALGAPMLDRQEWIGEMLDWGTLERATTSGIEAVLVERRIERFQAGAFDLMLRAWNRPMETGPRLYAEFLPRYHQPQSMSYLELIEEPDEGVAGQPFPALAVAIDLEPDLVYVLTGAAASMRTSVDGVDSDDAGLGSSRSRGSTGPTASLPRTLGELLMVRQAPPARRTVLVLRARRGNRGMLDDRRLP